MTLVSLAFVLGSVCAASEQYPVKGEDSQRTSFDLTEREKSYLAQKQTIKVCVDPSWMPFEAIENDTHVGISADYLDLVSQELGITFQLVPTQTWTETLEKGKARECDIFALSMETPERKRYMNFTKPYIVIPLVIASTKDTPFIADIPDIAHQRIGLVRDYAFIEFLRSEYPQMDIVEFDTLYEGLSALEKNEIYGFIDSLTTISYEIQRSFSSSIKISGRVNRNWDLGFAVRNDDPVLLAILDKAVRNIDKKAVDEIRRKWFSVTYENQIDYSLLWKVFAVVVVLVFLFVYRHWKINIFNKRLQELNRKLKEREESFQYLINNAQEGIVVAQNKRIAYASPSMCKMTGYDQDALRNMETFLTIIAPEARETVMANHLKRTSGQEAPQRYESIFLKRDGTTCPVEISGTLINWNGTPATMNIISDISERKAAEETIRYIALHDNLTGLPNRYLLKERIEQALAQARRSQQSLGVLYMDLNDFKPINDTHGHDVGDMVLKEFASRVRTLMRDSDTLARMGGDEFVMLLNQVNGKMGVETLVARIESILQLPFNIRNLTLKISTSVGIAIYPENGNTEEALLRVADQHMYHVKHSKKPSSRPR
jgi:diguanylate cyclase (GGDEF)-like protein/PAS domain S-box-containing protein